MPRLRGDGRGNLYARAKVVLPMISPMKSAAYSKNWLAFGGVEAIRKET